MRHLGRAGSAACAVAIAAGILTVGATGTRQVNSPLCGVPQTSDVVLTGSIACDGDNGLVAGADGITFDLNGYTVSGDATAGRIGIDVNGHTGVRIVHGRVFRFDTGIRVEQAPRTTISGLDVVSPVGTGISAHIADKLVLKGSTVVEAGADGVAVVVAAGAKIDGLHTTTTDGDGLALSGVSSLSIVNSSMSRSATRAGIEVLSGTGITISKTAAASNYLPGLWLYGGVSGLTVKDTTFVGNGVAGIRLSSLTGALLQKVTVAGNANGISLQSPTSAVTIAQSTVSGNDTDGIVVCNGCDGTIVSRTTAIGNFGYGIRTLDDDTLFKSDAAYGNDTGISGVAASNDGGGNVARGNRVLQCTVCG